MALKRLGGESLNFGIPSAYLHALLTSQQTPQSLTKLKPHTMGWDISSPILPPRDRKVRLADITRNVGRLIRLTSCKRCSGSGKITVRELDKRGGLGSGSAHYEKRKCPACKGRGYLRTNKLVAYEILADMADPLVYLDTQATTVRPSQASKITAAIKKVADRISKKKIPVELIDRAVTKITSMEEGKAHRVCLAVRIIKKVNSGNRDYLLAKVVGHEDAVVAIVTNAGQYKFDPKGEEAAAPDTGDAAAAWEGRRSDFDPDSSYLVAGLAVGHLETTAEKRFDAFLWPALIVRPGVVYYTQTDRFQAARSFSRRRRTRLSWA